MKGNGCLFLAVFVSNPSFLMKNLFMFFIFFLTHSCNSAIFPNGSNWERPKACFSQVLAKFFNVFVLTVVRSLGLQRNHVRKISVDAVSEVRGFNSIQKMLPILFLESEA